MDNNLFNLDDLENVLEQLNQMDDTVDEAEDEEMLASQKRYQEIIKKHQHDNL